MIDAREYIAIMIKKRGLTNKGLVERINKLGLARSKYNETHFSSMMTGKIPLTELVARRIEVALGLEKDSLVKLSTASGVKSIFNELEAKMEENKDDRGR